MQVVLNKTAVQYNDFFSGVLDNIINFCLPPSSIHAVPNLCAANNGNCSHLCLLSSTALAGYSCACPDGLINSDNPNICRGEAHRFEYP